MAQESALRDYRTSEAFCKQDVVPRRIRESTKERDMEVYGNKFKPGDKVVCNGNPQGRVIGYYSTRMVEVRLWDGFRHVGDVCVDETELQPLSV
jgi:uncharacterized protein YodC (DUF2158 family)